MGLGFGRGRLPRISWQPRRDTNHRIHYRRSVLALGRLGSICNEQRAILVSYLARAPVFDLSSQMATLQRMTKGGADERRSTRSKVMLTATIESECGDVKVRVEDLSAHGARVLSETLFPVDTPVTFRCKAITVDGFVAWVEAPFAGIGFGEPVQPEEARRKVSPVQATMPKDFRRPGFRARRLTNAERQSIEDWTKPRRSRPGE